MLVCQLVLYFFGFVIVAEFIFYGLFIIQGLQIVVLFIGRNLSDDIFLNFEGCFFMLGQLVLTSKPPRRRNSKQISFIETLENVPCDLF